ncbi:hypothetical protein [Mesorhizobium sp. M1B.F.Ca.ET.045.04.1.1]|uniref:hypothetical protein n=1 Tax=Mesorhizobium sp. M1B.F.Ca.ET.045.04.1.1 TaxID=2493673 RepID=UPI000F75BA96|nr:hypothetical protein [Mesorhizobium sp. M1B.F.Ca.ET.045.04.1.1]AZO29444.1 hypothetical protein EJ071_19965 [Mesorhizobium sp. M1B.F.Ca.ET.045.04.1.1]
MISISLTGCATNKWLLGQAYSDKAKADAAKEALAAAEKVVQDARRMPPYPPQCERQWHSGVTMGDRFDTATKKTDNALGGANGQIAWCAAWYHRNERAREPKK